MLFTGFVEPPRDLTAYSWAETFFTALMALVTVIALIYAVRKREWVLLVLLPAAAVSSLIEPFYDAVGGAWWATNISTSFEAFDGRIYNPTIYPLGYVCWVGLGSYSAYRIYLKHPSRSRMLWGFAFLALTEPVLELPWIHTKLLAYYGPQPYLIFGYSFIWCAINTAGVALGGALLLAMKTKLHGRGILRAAVIPFVLIGSYFSVGWPTWLSYQAGAPVPVLWVAGTITIALCAAQIYVLTGYVTRRNAGRSALSTETERPTADAVS
jgi:hypothetical protein